jgi:hypothetical protein
MKKEEALKLIEKQDGQIRLIESRIDQLYTDIDHASEHEKVELTRMLDFKKSELSAAIGKTVSIAERYKNVLVEAERKTYANQKVAELRKSISFESTVRKNLQISPDSITINKVSLGIFIKESHVSAKLDKSIATIVTAKLEFNVEFVSVLLKITSCASLTRGV